MGKILEIDSVVKSFGGLTALANVSFSMTQGHIKSLIGPNGAGKTTLLNTISGLIRCAQGEVYFEDRKINRLAPEKIVAAGISQVPEGRQIFGPLTALENLQLGAYLRFRKKKKKSTKLTEPSTLERYSKQSGGVIDNR